MKKASGFTLIEIVIFIIITGVFASTILFAFLPVLQKTPLMHQQMVATQTAKQCMEWFIGQRRMLSYANLSCPSTPSPTLCAVPSGYSIATNITCTTLNTDSNYKTITVTVSGAGDATLTSLIADY